MLVYLLAFLLGVVSGLRSMTPLTIVSWAAKMGRLHLGSTWLSFLGSTATPYILSVLALGELIADKLPKTPSRKQPAGLIGRICTGALCGAALGAPQAITGGLFAGAIGGLVGTFAGAEMRARLAQAFGGNDLPAALLEDAITIAAALWIVLAA